MKELIVFLFLPMLGGFGFSQETELLDQNRDNLNLYMPNAFTPDGDGINDVFLPVFNASYSPTYYVMTIFNRWGDVIFESNDSTEGWDGNIHCDGLSYEADQDVYTWKINYKLTEQEKIKLVTGHITLLR